MPYLLRQLACCALLFIVVDCTDQAVIGTNASASALCKGGCTSDQQCHPQMKICVGCVTSDDCDGAGDAGKRFCDQASFECVQCRSSDDCAGGAACSSGKCAACSRDDECGDNAECDNGQCKADDGSGGDGKGQAAADAGKASGDSGNSGKD